MIGQKYSNKYDNIEIDQILSNKRVLNNYIKCILDEGPCTPDGREFRGKKVRQNVSNEFIVLVFFYYWIISSSVCLISKNFP